MVQVEPRPVPFMVLQPEATELVQLNMVLPTVLRPEVMELPRHRPVPPMLRPPTLLPPMALLLQVMELV